MLKQQLDADLKAAMLSGDKQKADALKLLKSAILYKEVELKQRDTGLSDDQVIDVLTKEGKKRSEAADMYAQANRQEQAANETYELNLIQSYLPEQLGDQELSQKVDEVVTEFPNATIKDMGKIIGAVKTSVGNTAESSRIAGLVKQKLTE